MINYSSTRGNSPQLSFEETVLAGLAPDGGLYLPTSLPQFSPSDIADMRGLSYVELAHRIISPFADGAFTSNELRELLEKSYATFDHTAIAPLKQLGQNEWVMELFHGPTLAFKDFALQFLGNLMDFFLKRRGEKAIVLGATSGDTGSAAIAGCHAGGSMDIVILFPDGKVSDVQRRQMTTYQDSNVHCVAVDGNFDDCQNIVKALFVDAEFKQKHHLIAVNSINWARILAQMVYYFHAALSIGSPAQKVSFSVPTGNFGDIYAGYLAKKMGLPVDRLIIASNKNDVLTRCHKTKKYDMAGVESSLSPSMDIEISSNFERLLFNLYDGDASATNSLMENLKQNGEFTLSNNAYSAFIKEFDAFSLGDKGTKDIIKQIFEQTGEILDPHSAVGVAAAHACKPTASPVVTLATAHPAKFPDAVTASCGIKPSLPAHLHDLFNKPERMIHADNDAAAIKDIIAKVSE